jgi:hypothetical protein
VISSAFAHSMSTRTGMHSGAALKMPHNCGKRPEIWGVA